MNAECHYCGAATEIDDDSDPKEAECEECASDPPQCQSCGQTDCDGDCRKNAAQRNWNGWAPYC